VDADPEGDGPRGGPAKDPAIVLFLIVFAAIGVLCLTVHPKWGGDGSRLLWWAGVLVAGIAGLVAGGTLTRVAETLHTRYPGSRWVRGVDAAVLLMIVGGAAFAVIGFFATVWQIGLFVVPAMAPP
jgi:hypothetical protein